MAEEDNTVVEPTLDPLSGASLGGTPHPKSEEEYERVPFGTKYVSPEGETLTKYHRPQTPTEYIDVPEGAEYMDPEGTVRKKAVTQPLSWSTQTLYNMGINDKERKKALEWGYPGKVKKDDLTGELIIAEDDGTIRKPKGITEAPGAAGTAMALPVAGAVVGSFAGVGPWGTVGGGMLGQSANDIILALTGIQDRTIAEQGAATGLAGAGAITGYGVGKGAAAIAPAVGAAVKHGGAPVLATVFGSTKEGVEQAIALRNKGVLVPPSAWTPEAPYMINLTEVFDPAFRTQKPLQQSAIAHFEKTGEAILREAGVEAPESLTKPTAAISLKPTGEALKLRAMKQLQELDARFDAEVAKRKQTLLEQHKGEISQSTESLQQTAEASRKAAQDLINVGFKDLDNDIDVAMRAAKAGHNSGDLWATVGEKIRAYRDGIMNRARKMYDQADAAAGDKLPNSEGLSNIAETFLQDLPEGFENRFPTIVKQLRDLAGAVDKDGKVIKEPVTPTFGQLHNLRSYMRSNYNHFDLTPDVKDGTFKFFAQKVDAVLHDSAAGPELREASRLLRGADDFYRDNLGPLADKRIQTVLDGLRSGMPADPKVLYDVIVKEGRTEVMNKVRDIVGPTMWSAIRATDVKDMLEMSKTLIPGQIDGHRFAQQVVDRYRRGLLESVHGKEAADKVLRQAQAIEALGGKIDVPVREGDTLFDVISRSRLAADAAEAAAKKDPLGELNREMRKIEVEAKSARRGEMKKMGEDPLNFLYNPAVGAIKSAERILESDDLIIAAAARFGENSREFAMLRRNALERILRQTVMPGEVLQTMSPEAQQILFRGSTLDQLKTLAKEMDFLLSTKSESQASGKSIAAQSRINHPWGDIPIWRGIGKIPPFGFVGRQILGFYYRTATWLMNNPALMQYVQKGLKSGDPAVKAQIRQTLEKSMRPGGQIGAGVGEATVQLPVGASVGGGEE